MKINRIYLVATLVSIGIIITNQVFIQVRLDQMQGDAKVINVSGRQRMLSQQLLVKVLQYKDSGDHQYLEEAGALHSEWKSAHTFLTANSTKKHLLGQQAPILAGLDTLGGYIEKASVLLTTFTSREGGSYQAFEQNQTVFLERMEAMVLQLQETSDQKLSFVIAMELVLAGLSLLLIGYEIIFIFRRITLRLQRKNEALEVSNALLEEYASLASHDLREPIQNVINFTHLLSREGPNPQARQQYLKYVLEAGQRMKHTTDVLLQIAKLHQADVELQYINPAQLFTHLKQDLAGLIEERQADIVQGLLPDQLYVDGEALSLIFQNLLSNALKFVPPDRSPRIQIAYQLLAGYHVFSITDNGLGIVEADQQKIFRLFQRLHTVKAYDGTGIGLAVVSRLLQRMDGHIELESTPGKGSTFRVFVPLIAP